jgi:nifR3 family TIM-barrel protein
MEESKQLDSPFKIGNIAVPGRVLLAPMDGFTDSPFRSICRKFGSAASYSEFINGIDVKYGHPHLPTRLYFTPEERPFCYQVFDDDPERLLLAAQKLLPYEPDFFDINMGCSARNVSNRGAGAGLMRDVKKIGYLSSLLVRHLPVPVTAKIRLGWDDSSKNFLEVASVLVESGISAISLHARTRKQEYSGAADWDAIAEIKASTNSIPIIGNGDVKNLEDARRLMVHTNCDAVMIGRAALGNPWVFYGQNQSTVSKGDLCSVISQHLQNMCAQYPPRIGVLMFRKHLARYLFGYLKTSDIRRHIFSIETPDELLQAIQILIFTEEETD